MHRSFKSYTLDVGATRPGLIKGVPFKYVLFVIGGVPIVMIWASFFVNFFFGIFLSLVLFGSLWVFIADGFRDDLQFAKILMTRFKAMGPKEDKKRFGGNSFGP